MAKTGALSNMDIEQLLGKDIFIYPYSSGNAKGGSTYNLTASCFAYYVQGNDKIYAVKDNKIIIPKHTTVLIQTEESIHVSNKICGTYHSKVSLVSKGLGHIGTTLDPMYFGTSKIAIQNTTEAEQHINVGETFVSLMFYKTVSKANSRHDNGPGRKDIVAVDIEALKDVEKKNIDETVKEKLREFCGKEHYNNVKSLIDVVIKEKSESTLGRKQMTVDTITFICSLVFSFVPLISILVYWIFKPTWIVNILQNETYIAIIIASSPLLWFILKLVSDFIKSRLKGAKL